MTIKQDDGETVDHRARSKQKWGHFNGVY